MKLNISVLFLIAAVFAVAQCFPRVGEKEADDVTAEETDSAEDESSGEYGFFPIRVPTFFNFFDDFVSSVAHRLKSLVSAGPGPEWGKVTNETSVQKVVNGHVVTINDTTYTKEGNDSDSVIFFRVIDVKPTEISGEVQPTNPEAEVEEVEKKHDTSNEISQGQDQDSAPAELLETREFDPTYDEVDNSIDVFETKPISLGSDILVNKIRQDETKGGIFMVPNDVEVFDVQDGKPVYSYHPNDFSQRSQKIVT